MKLLEGQIIHRRYRLDSRIAKGGMGEVWKAYDLELNRPVAIKALRGDIIADSTKLVRLRAEAHNSANLAHPNIAALFEYYEHDGIGFLIMEYVPSKSLAQIYKAEGRMDPGRLLPILIQVARGLYVAHSHGVIHRDIKPANIMVSDSGEVKITDFGVSYSTNQAQITQEGMVVGTAQYISPEQAQGKHATPRSDIYSLGVVAYEGLAGHRPFTGATPADIAAAQVNDPVPPLPDDVDPQIAAYVMRMLAKDPKDRPQNALEVSGELGRLERDVLDARTNSFPAVGSGSGLRGSGGARAGSGGSQANASSSSPTTRAWSPLAASGKSSSQRTARRVRSGPHRAQYHIHSDAYAEYPEYTEAAMQQQKNRGSR